MSTTINHIIYEHVFTPEQAHTIYQNTNGTTYNFRSAESRNRAVQHLAQAMRAGEWRWQEANPIRLSDDWTQVSDGGHRLLACHLSGVPLRSLVLVGDRWAAGINSDRGRSRTLAQYFKSMNITSAAVKAAIVRGHIARVKAVQRGVLPNYANTVFVHDSELIDFAIKHADTLDPIPGKAALAGTKGMNVAGYGIFILEASTVDPELVNDLHATLAGDVTAENENDPVVRLRQFAVRRFDATGKRFSQEATIRAFVKCWDLRLRGEALRVWKQPTHDDVRFPAGFTLPVRITE